MAANTIMAEPGQKTSGNRANDVPHNPAILGTPFVEKVVRRLLWEGLKSAAKPRTEIARRMTEILGRPVTSGMLADFIRSPHKKRAPRFPAAWVPAFCAATGKYELALFPLPEHMRRDIAVGQWVRESTWILERVRAEIPKLPKSRQKA